MSKLKTAMFEEESALEKLEKEQVEVIGDTIDESLRLAAKHFGKEIYQLDYEVLERGKRVFFSHIHFEFEFSLPIMKTIFRNLRDLIKINRGSGKLLSKELKIS